MSLCALDKRQIEKHRNRFALKAERIKPAVVLQFMLMNISSVLRGGFQLIGVFEKKKKDAFEKQESKSLEMYGRGMNIMYVTRLLKTRYF